MRNLLSSQMQFSLRAGYFFLYGLCLQLCLQLCFQLFLNPMLAFSQQTEQATGQTLGPQGGPPFGPFEFILNTTLYICIGAFSYYLLVTKPKQDKEQGQKNLLAQLKQNDEVVTSGGILGRVQGVKPDAILIEIAPNVRIRVLPQHVQVVNVENVSAVKKENSHHEAKFESKTQAKVKP